MAMVVTPSKVARVEARVEGPVGMGSMAVEAGAMKRACTKERPLDALFIALASVKRACTKERPWQQGPLDARAIMEAAAMAAAAMEAAAMEPSAIMEPEPPATMEAAAAATCMAHMKAAAMDRWAKNARTL